MANNYEALSVAGTAVAITSTLLDDHHDRATIYVDAAAIRFRTDGTAPTATTGTPAVPGDIIKLEDGELPDFQAISRDGGTATLYVTTHGKSR